MCFVAAARRSLRQHCHTAAGVAAPRL
jgi:hypothetical protein